MYRFRGDSSLDPTVMIATKKDIEVVESKFKKITGDKNELVTKNKSNLVAVINEVATDLIQDIFLLFS